MNESSTETEVVGGLRWEVRPSAVVTYAVVAVAAEPVGGVVGGGGKQMLLGENERCFCSEGEKVYVKTECYLISNWRNNSKRRQRGKVRGKINESGLTHSR